jgi:FimV-like protein
MTKARHNKNRLHVAILAAMASLNAQAIGMGEIAVRSKLNQPLRAEVPMIELSARDLDQARVFFRPVEDIAVGSTNSTIVSKLSGRFVDGGGGRYQLQIRSTENIREPVVTFYVEVVLPNAHTRREFTVLLDPQVLPDSAAAAVAPGMVAQSVDFDAMEQSITALSAPAGAKRDRSLQAESPAAATSTAPTAPAAERPRERKTGTLNGDTYGPVMPNETLWAIARRVRPNRDLSMQEVMTRVLEANPDAFINRDMDRLRVGVSLHIPDLSGAAATQAVETAVAGGASAEPPPPTQTDVTEAAPAPAASTNDTAPGAHASNTASADAPAATETAPAASGVAAVSIETPAAASPAVEGTAAATGAQADVAADTAAMTAQLESLSARIEELQRLAEEREAQILALQSTLGELQQRLDTPASGAPATPSAAQPPLTLPVVAPAAPPAAGAPELARPVTPEVAAPEMSTAAESGGADARIDAQAVPAGNGWWWGVSTVVLAGLAGAFTVMRSRRTTNQAPREAREDWAAREREDARLREEVAQKINRPAPATRSAAPEIVVAPVVDLAPEDAATNLPAASHIVIDPSSDQNTSGIWNEESMPNWSLQEDAEATVALAPAPPTDSGMPSPAPADPSATAVAAVVPLRMDSTWVEPILKEVDLQIAYLQYEDAERLLTGPLADHPNEPALLVKLAEVHVAAGAVEKFVELATRLSQDEQFRNSEHWTKIARMGETIAPTHPLFEFVATVEIAPEDLGDVHTRA